MALQRQPRQQTSNCSLLLIYRPRKDGLSWPGWLTYSGWFSGFTHISGHPSATGRAQDSESTPAKDRCSTAGPRNQPKSVATLDILSTTDPDYSDTVEFDFKFDSRYFGRGLIVVQWELQ